jgi:NADH pyrophosphatase NudC (nudix superfamily)
MTGQPFPANLMVGFYATGDSSEPIRTDLDKELEGTHDVANSNYPGSLYR